MCPPQTPTSGLKLNKTDNGPLELQPKSDRSFAERLIASDVPETRNVEDAPKVQIEKRVTYQTSDGKTHSFRHVKSYGTDKLRIDNDPSWMEQTVKLEKAGRLDRVRLEDGTRSWEPADPNDAAAVEHMRSGYRAMPRDHNPPAWMKGR